MKLFISENIDKAIEGYTLVPIVYGKVDLTKIPDNAASHIVAIDALDKINYQDLQAFLQNILSKLRLNGIINLGGIDAYALSRSLISGNTDLKEFNEEISTISGIYSAKIIVDLLHKFDLNINDVVYKGDRYEVTATRSKN